VKKELEVKTVPVNEGWSGEKLGNNVFKMVNGKKVLLLRKGKILTKNILYRFKQHGVGSIEIYVPKGKEKKERKVQEEGG